MSPGVADPVYVLGYNQNHDAGAALSRNGEIVCAIAQERLSRKKHDGPRVREAIEYVMASEGLGPEQLDLIVACNHGRPEAGADTTEREYHQELARAAKRVHVHSSHHELHAYSAFYTSPFRTAGILVADGMGSRLIEMDSRPTPTDNNKSNDLLLYQDYREGETLYGASDRELVPLWRRLTTHSPYQFTLEDISLGRLYNYASKALFGSRFAAGKVMALASYGTPGGVSSFLLECGDSVMIDPEKLNVFGGIPPDDNPFDHRNLASRVQADLEYTLLMRARYLRRHWDSENLCVAGGVGLNCTANRRMQTGCGYAEMYCMPAASDDGVAIGAALYGHYNVLGHARSEVHEFNPYLGMRYSPSQIEQAISVKNRSLRNISITKYESRFHLLAEEVAQRLDAGLVVAWYQGASEFGPRALGNRSILADPRRAQVREYINAEVKMREWFRPLAPVVIESDCGTYFEVEKRFRSPYMMFNVPVRTSMRERIPAVVHVDGTARVQTVSEQSNRRLATLLRHFADISHTPILLNTSLNSKEEPIVETALDAIDFFCRSKIDALVLEDWLLLKRP